MNDEILIALKLRYPPYKKNIFGGSEFIEKLLHMVAFREALETISRKASSGLPIAGGVWNRISQQDYFRIPIGVCLNMGMIPGPTFSGDMDRSWVTAISMSIVSILGCTGCPAWPIGASVTHR